MRDVIKERIRHRCHQQRQHQTQSLAADHGNRHRSSGTRACTRAQRQRNHARHKRRRSHQNRTQPIFAAFENRIQTRHAFGPQLLDVIDLQNRIFLHDSEEHQDAKTRIDDREIFAHHQQAEQRERHRQRQAQQNGDGVDEALKLRRQNHVHEDQRQNQGDHIVGCRAPQFFRTAQQSRGVFKGQIHICNGLVDCVDGFAQRSAGRDVALNQNLSLPIEALNLGWPCSRAESGHALNWHVAQC